MIKKILIAFVSIILIGAIFITEESIRLENKDTATPLIVFKTDTNTKVNSTEKEDIYHSFGFTLKKIIQKIKIQLKIISTKYILVNLCYLIDLEYGHGFHNT